MHHINQRQNKIIKDNLNYLINGYVKTLNEVSLHSMQDWGDFFNIPIRVFKRFFGTGAGRVTRMYDQFGREIGAGSTHSGLTSEFLRMLEDAIRQGRIPPNSQGERMVPAVRHVLQHWPDSQLHVLPNGIVLVFKDGQWFPLRGNYPPYGMDAPIPQLDGWDPSKPLPDFLNENPGGWTDTLGRGPFNPRGANGVGLGIGGGILTLPGDLGNVPDESEGIDPRNPAPIRTA